MLGIAWRWRLVWSPTGCQHLLTCLSTDYFAATLSNTLPLGASCTPWGANGMRLGKRYAPDVAKSNY